MNGYVVARDNRLRWKIDVLLAQVDGSQTRARVGPVNRSWLIKKRHQNVEPARGDLIKLPETLDQHHRCLRDDPDRLDRNNQQHYEEKPEEQKPKNRSNWIHNRLPYAELTQIYSGTAAKCALHNFRRRQDHFFGERRAHNLHTDRQRTVFLGRDSHDRQIEDIESLRI